MQSQKQERIPCNRAFLASVDDEERAIHTDFTERIPTPSIFSTVGAICQRKPSISPSARALPLYEMMRTNPQMTEMCVVDELGKVCGILTRNYLIGRFSGQFGYSLCSRRLVGELLASEYQYLAVDCKETVDAVAARAMDRDFESVYDAVIITEDEKYLGIVTVRELLMSAIRLQVENAAEANPLTGLPGNHAIQRTIESYIQKQMPCAIVYLDLDNFKAYNDCYGFASGDGMLKLVAQAIHLCCEEQDFKGHIGGDDFVVITQRITEVHALCTQIIQVFSQLIKPLYSAADWERGYISSKNRNGFSEDFPIATLSIAAVTNTGCKFSNTKEVSQSIALAKKKSKQQKGHAIVVV